MAATVARWINTGETVTASAVVDTSGVAVGEAMVVLMCIGSTSITVSPPADWVALFPKTSMGSRACLGFVKVKGSSDEVSATFTASGATGQATALLGIIGALPANWAIGPVWTRSVHGTSLTNVIDGWTASVADSLALALSFEATTAAESPNTIAGVNNGFVELGYKAQNSIIETIWAGTKAVGPGDVGDVTVTYRNTQASNGAGIMIGLPPTATSVTAPAVAATGGGTAPAPTIRISATPVSPAAAGSGTMAAPVLRSGSTVTPSASTGTGTSPSPSVHISVDAAAAVSSGTGSMPAPAAEIDTRSTPPASTGTGSVSAPMIRVEVIVSVPTAIGSGTVDPPIVTALSGVIASAPSANGTGQAHAPVLHAGVTVSAPEALGSGTMPAPNMGDTSLPVKGILVAITPFRQLQATTPSRNLVAITSSRGLEVV